MARIAEGDDAWAEGASREDADVSPSSQVGPVDGGLASGELQAGRPEVHRGRERCGRGRRRGGVAGGEAGHDLGGDVWRGQNVDVIRVGNDYAAVTEHRLDG